jgi:hypothetical protein
VVVYIVFFSWGVRSYLLGEKLPTLLSISNVELIDGVPLLTLMGQAHIYLTVGICMRVYLFNRAGKGLIMTAQVNLNYRRLAGSRTV